mmetsp:Transcript_12621/g.33984  ORF Transcript_12621/g.33984 Transcript_12621/m.33984 type:complete len:226 (+) Transcript_12621:1318-1995(+)
MPSCLTGGPLLGGDKSPSESDGSCFTEGPALAPPLRGGDKSLSAPPESRPEPPALLGAAARPLGGERSSLTALPTPALGPAALPAAPLPPPRRGVERSQSLPAGAAEDDAGAAPAPREPPSLTLRPIEIFQATPEVSSAALDLSSTSFSSTKTKSSSGSSAIDAPTPISPRRKQVSLTSLAFGSISDMSRIFIASGPRCFCFFSLPAFAVPPYEARPPPLPPEPS